MKHDGLKFRDCVKVLKRNGFVLHSQNGSHCKFVNGSKSLVICDTHAGVNRMSNAIITMLDEYSKKLVECGVMDGSGTPKKTTRKAQGIYDQDDDGKMTKIAEGRFSDMAKGAWRAIKGGAEKVWSWVSETFFPQFIVKEEKFSDLVSRFDGYLGEVEGAIA